MNRRKQKLEEKVEMTSSQADDPFLTNNDGCPGWLLDNESASLDISPSLASIGDDFFNLLDNLPVDLDDGALSQENKEIFQDLRFTSTPKSRPADSKICFDSGIEETCSSKKIKLHISSASMLHDITDKLDSSANSFINLSQLSESLNQESSSKKHVPILRKDVQVKIKPPKPGKVEKNKMGVSKEELTYYTGIKNYSTAIGILKHLKMPKSHLSPFKMQLFTLMKLRLNLQWKDMALRFSIPEKHLIDMTRKGFDVMDFALSELLPWHVSRRAVRRTMRFFYAHSIFCEETGIQVLIVLIDNKKPVLFVSDAHPLDKSPVYMLNDCSSYFIPSDVICLSDVQGNRTYFRIDRSTSGLSLVSLDEGSFINCPFVENCQRTVIEILSEFTLILKPESGMDLVKLIKIAAAITNVNSLGDVPIHPSAFSKILERSLLYLEKAKA